MGRPRYQITLVTGRITTTYDRASLDAAKKLLDRHAKRHPGDKDAFGWVHDREAMATVASWSGAPKRRPLPTLVDIFAMLAQRALEGRGAPVSIIGPRGAVHFDAQGGAA